MQPPKHSEITLGSKIGELTVVGYEGKPEWLYVCQCSCGKTTKKRKQYLKNFHTPNCGCLSKKIWRSKNAEMAVLSRVKDRYLRGAISRELRWDVSDEEFYSKLKSPCHYCGIEYSMCGDRARSSYVSSEIKFNGIDRKDNKLGYTSENTVPCCDVCNRAKSTLNFSEFISWINRVGKNKVSE